MRDGRGGEQLLKSVPTTYRGITYRSRAEARWAVVFDQLGWTHHYEPEAFDLPSGRYLPDFLLPEVQAYFEVKGREPSAIEKRFARELCEAAEMTVVMSSGPPNPSRKQWDEDLLTFVPERFEDEVDAYAYRGGFVDGRREYHPACSIDLGNLAHLGSLREISWCAAFQKAATARFGVFE